MEYRINTIEGITIHVRPDGSKYILNSKAINSPQKNSNNEWYYPVYGWRITPQYRTEFTSLVSVSTSAKESSTVVFYLCGPVDQNYFVVDVDRDTGVPNLPIVAQTTIYNPGDPDYWDDESTGNTVSDYLNIGSAYGGTELAANETYILFFVRTGAAVNDKQIVASFETTSYTDEQPQEEWYILHAPWYDSVNVSGYSVSNLLLPQYNLLCFAIHNTDSSGNPKDGSWTVEVNAGADATIYVGSVYGYNSVTGIPNNIGGQLGHGTNFTVKDILPTMSFIWIRFSQGSSEANISVNISYKETQVETQWHAHTPTISMNGGTALPASGSETWTDGLGEKEVLIYQFRLSKDFMPVFSYNGSQSLWMCISTVDNVNSTNGSPQPSNAIRGQGNGTSFSVTASEVLTADTWYYLFVETSNGEAYDGQIVITYQAGIAPQPPDWTYTDYPDEINISQVITRQYRIEDRVGAKLTVTFASSGYATVDVSSFAGTLAYVVPWVDYGFDPDDGVPYTNTEKTSKASGSSQNTFYANSGQYYVIWIKRDGDSFTADVSTVITPPSAAQGWTYDDSFTNYMDISSETSAPVSVSSYTGAMFCVSFTGSGTANFSTSGASAYVFVTTGNYGWRTDTGVPFEDISEATGGPTLDYTVSAGLTYYVWIKGTTENISGNVTVSINPPSSSADWVEIPVGSVVMTTASRSFDRPMALRRTYRYDIEFTNAGRYRIYCTGADYQHDAAAYFGTQNLGIRKSDGKPNDSAAVEWDDTGTGSSKDYNFDSGVFTVQAGAAAYLWVKCVSVTATAQITIYIVPIQDSGGKVWIYTGSTSGWVQAVPYIYTSAGWKQATPYIYTGQGTDPWKACT